MLVNEVRTLLRRARIRVLLGLLAAIPVLIAVVVRVSHHSPPAGQGPDFLSQVSQNGVFAALTGLDVVVGFLLPLAVAVAAGDAIAGEAGMGTLRYLLTAPVTRVRLLVVKASSLAVFCLTAAVVVVVAGLVAGAALFPVGPVLTLSGSTVPLIDGVGRILLGGGYVAVEVFALALLGLFVSTCVDNALAAAAITVVVAVLSEILDAVPQIGWLHPYLFTHDWTSFADLLRNPISWSGLAHGLLLALGWGALGATAAWARFTTRDILS
jgi:ABC-2 type transport system permease protein